jgi:hypothetical protein
MPAADHELETKASPGLSRNPALLDPASWALKANTGRFQDLDAVVPCDASTVSKIEAG